MKSSEYENQFVEILEGKNTSSPYNKDAYINYVKTNQSRIRRWTKNGKLLPELVEEIKKIEDLQHWVLITEPWCGDAAHSHAFIVKLAELNSKISLTIQNRDAPNSEIEDYLTNGGRSIPKLIVRNTNGKDLFDWGPRPKEAQKMVMSQKDNLEKSTEEKQQELQQWYNKDKGKSMQRELLEFIKDSI